jgi:hypothetical protein
VGWIKATLVNRVTIKGKPKEVVIDYAVTEEKLDDETDFDLEKLTHTVKLGLKIPVMSLLSELTVENMPNSDDELI